jgi:hypothetical protein
MNIQEISDGIMINIYGKYRNTEFDPLRLKKDKKEVD